MPDRLSVHTRKEKKRKRNVRNASESKEPSMIKSTKRTTQKVRNGIDSSKQPSVELLIRLNQEHPKVITPLIKFLKVYSHRMN